jgi:hypothetical protein
VHRGVERSAPGGGGIRMPLTSRRSARFAATL